MPNIQPFFIFLITFILILKISKFFKVSSLDASKIYIFRCIISLAYLSFLYYIKNTTGIGLDAFGYYNSADYFISSGSDFARFYGTGLIGSINFFLKHKLYLTHYSSFLIFTFIGTIGSILLFSIIKDLTRNSDSKLKTLSGLIVYMPIFNLWTASIGKDAITFTCINLIIFSFLKLNSRFLLLIISATFLTLIRPYIGIVLVFSLFLSIPLKKDLKLNYKLFFIISILAFTQIIVNFVYTTFSVMLLMLEAKCFLFLELILMLKKAELM